MMSFIKSLIRRILSTPHSQESNEPKDHYERLEYLRKHHEWIGVKITKNDHLYQSMVLNIDPDNAELLIDELFPSEGLESLESGDTVEITSRSQRVDLHFYTRILARQEHGDDVSYLLELPEEVGRNHSRNAYRIYVESETGLNIELYLEQQPIPDVRIINLSSEGIKLSFAEDITDILEKNKFFPASILRLPDGSDIDCQVELCNLYRIRTPHMHTLAGARLTVDNPQQRVKLQQYIAAVQRKQRRRESRVS